MLWEGTVIRATVVQNGLPRGAKLVGSFNEPPYVSLVFEHESLPDLAQDETAILCPVFADISVHERWRPDTMALVTDVLRTPDACFADLPGYPFAPRYAEVEAELKKLRGEAIRVVDLYTLLWLVREYETHRDEYANTAYARAKEVTASPKQMDGIGPLKMDATAASGGPRESCSETRPTASLLSAITRAPSGATEFTR